MQSGTSDKIKVVVISHFVLDDIIAAKDMLWANADNDIIGDRKRRRDGSNTSEKEAHAQDIIAALYQLDGAGKTPDIVISALELGAIPRSHPEELNDISMADRLNKMEERLSSLAEVVDRTVATNMTLRDQVDTLTSKQNYRGSYAAVSVMPRPTSNTVPCTISTAPSLSDAINHRVDRVDPAQSGTSSGTYQDTGRSQHLLPQRNMDVRPKRDKHLANPRLKHIGDSSMYRSVDSVISDNNSVAGSFKEPSYVLKQHRRQENKRRQIVHGSRISGSVRGAPEPCRDAFIYRVDRGTTTEAMHKYISDCDIDIKNLDCVSNPNAKYKSFRLTTTVSKFKELFNEDLWPAGFRIRKYISTRKNDDY